MIMLVLSSLAILSAMAIFRWKAHDEKINITTKIAVEYAMEFHPHKENLSDIIKARNETYDGAINYLKMTIKAIESEINSLNQRATPAENTAKILVDQYAKNQMQEYINALYDLGGKTHSVRRYFNWPFYISIISLGLYLVQANYQSFNMRDDSYFNISVDFMIIFAILVSIYGFYCLFNFSYNPGETDGLDKIRWLPFIRKNPDGNNENANSG